MQYYSDNQTGGKLLCYSIASELRRDNRQTRAILECSVVTYLAIIEWGWVGCKELCRSRRMLSTSDIFCVFLHLFRAVLVRNSATSSSDSRERHFLVHSRITASQPRMENEVDRWSVSLVSNEVYTIESMVCCSHLPNTVSTSWP